MDARFTRSKPWFMLLAGMMLIGTTPRIASAVTFDIGTGSTPTITTTSGTVVVPITLNDFAPVAGSGAKAFVATISLSSGLKFVPAGLTSAIKPGAYIKAVDPTPIFSATLNSDGTVTIVATMNPGLCSTASTGSFPGGGVLFEITVGTTLTSGNNLEHVLLKPAVSGDPTPSPTLRDCTNSDVTVAYGAHVDAPVQVTLCGPVGPPTNLIAEPVKSGNGNTPPGIAGIKLRWTNVAGGVPAGSTMDIWRAPFGYVDNGNWSNAYPEYDDGNLFIARAPDTQTGQAPITNPVPGQWEKIAAHPLATDLTFTDKPPTRGYWYYVVNYTDNCNQSLLSNTTTGTLDYLLGDINASGLGDNTVNNLDASMLGSVYGAAATPALAFVDFGPTMDHTPDGRPHPDDFIGFEDLMIYSMNYLKGSVPQLAAIPAPAARDELALDAPESVTAGQEFSAKLLVKGAGDLRGISTQLGWDASVAEPLSAEAGPLLAAQEGVALSAGPGNVDAVVLGRDGPGISGEGVLATVSFRATANGRPRIGIASLDARDRANRKVELSSAAPSSPLATALARVAPNPFETSTTFAFSLARAGRVELAIYSVDGRRIRTLANGDRDAGLYRLNWDGSDESGHPVSPGLFFVRLVTPEGGFSRTFARVR
jgi:hypothetical protein